MEYKNHSILIVDGISTAASYAPIFRAYGIGCVHIFSDESIFQNFGSLVNEGDYELSFVHDGDLERTLKVLSKWNFHAVLHGLDSALELVDTLGHELGLPYINDINVGLSRRHKFHMIETVAKFGIQVPDQYLTDDVNMAVNWVSTQCDLPVILKPVESAGVKGVFKCESIEQVRHYFDEIITSSSYYYTPNREVLIQSCSVGQEYIIDSVSLDGVSYVTSIWRVFRDTGDSPFLDFMETLDHQSDEIKSLCEYASKVLLALGVANGPTHLEVIITESGPKLVELNCRLHGSLDLRLTTYVCGRNHVQDVVSSILSPTHFVNSHLQPVYFKGQAMHVLLRSPEEGRVIRDSYWSDLERLPSFVSSTKNKKFPTITERTKDLKSAIGTLSLYNSDYSELKNDLLKVRAMEKSGDIYD
ncbi:TPA: ATP-grasp domain-containing protein [Enterobacter hormaechei subsp. xiangfangensis]|nr:ATP-grasp domain-containing protein [Enterobacter hormaechei subsp. xiangfangensis]